MLCWDFYSLCINGYFQVVVAYNPLGWNRTDIIKIPVSACLFCDSVSSSYFIQKTSRVLQPSILEVYNRIIKSSKGSIL